MNAACGRISSARDRRCAGDFREGIPIHKLQPHAEGPGLYGFRVTAIDRRSDRPDRADASGPRTSSQPESAPSTCPACGESAVVPRFRVEGVASEIVDCRGCGVGRFEPMPGREELRAFYPDAYYGGEGAGEPAAGESEAPQRKFHRGIEWMVRLVAARHVAFLARNLPRGARILDVGCGRGVVLNPLAAQGFETFGVEITRAAAAGLDPRVELRIAERLADAGFSDGHFDQVILWHVLEHLVDPLETLVECRRLLRPGGRLIVAVPNYSSFQARLTGRGWFHLDPPRHLYHFTLDGLRRIVARSGFVVRSEHHFSLRQNPFGWIQSVINLCTERPNRLYEFLQGIGGRPSAGEATLHMLQLGLGAPFALALTLAAAWLRNGASVHFVASRRTDSSDE